MIVILSLTANLFRDVLEVKEDVKCDKILDKVALCTFPGYNDHINNKNIQIETIKTTRCTTP